VTRVLIVPAAGLGARLGGSLPKLLTPVAGRAMVDLVIARYRAVVDAIVIVVNPAHTSKVEAYLNDRYIDITLVEQPEPTGMLDAILLGGTEVRVRRPDRVWITWCDQVEISEGTVSRLIALEQASTLSHVIMPVAIQPAPYIHFDRRPDGRLIGVRQRREGDDMPVTGTSDAGLFSLSIEAFERWLPQYALTAPSGTGTGERNFLPFLPWMASRGQVKTFEIDPCEASGINTPGDLAAVEARLRKAQGAGS
jgi:bifunctional UDP-N-acetylglucosamine pyrophosphorylase / glucosamine-1-phosphate N-acetyltransferase